MALVYMVHPKYEDITNDVIQYSFGHNVDDTELGTWDRLENIPPEELQKEHTYTLKDNSKQRGFLSQFLRRNPNKTITGKLKSVKSCTTAPRVLIEIETAPNQINRMTGRLYGSPSKLGVVLNDVIEIK